MSRVETARLGAAIDASLTELGNGGSRSIIPIERIDQRILLIRGQRVIIASDLAELYGVPTKALNQAVKRNVERFPTDFAFRLTRREKIEVVTNCDHLAKLRFSPILELMKPAPEPRRERIGFHPHQKRPGTVDRLARRKGR